MNNLNNKPTESAGTPSAGNRSESVLTNNEIVNDNTVVLQVYHGNRKVYSISLSVERVYGYDERRALDIEEIQRFIPFLQNLFAILPFDLNLRAEGGIS